MWEVEALTQRGLHNTEPVRWCFVNRRDSELGHSAAASSLVAAVPLPFLATFLNCQMRSDRILAQTGQISRERERESARNGASTKNVPAAALDRLAPKFPISHPSGLAWSGVDLIHLVYLSASYSSSSKAGRVPSYLIR